MSSKGRLLFVSPTPAARALDLQAYAVVVRHLRVFLPLLASLLFVTVLLWTFWRPKDIINPSTSPATESPQSPSNELISPRFESRDDKNQPYVLTAMRALQTGGEAGPVRLENPAAHMSLSTGEPVSIAATTGLYEPTTRHLTLTQGVTLRLPAYNLQTSRLLLDFRTHYATSTDPVTGTGPDGTALTAGGLTLHTDTGLLTFTGPARIQIVPQGK